MDFPGIWMTASGSLTYRVVPKCACSTIGQVMHASETGAYFDGDIHQTPRGALLKWFHEADRPALREAVPQRKGQVFTCVRNPYTRVLSGFLDKIAGLQLNGKPYRRVPLLPLLQRYGIENALPEGNGDFDQIAAFRQFLLMIRDGYRDKTDARDIHWAPVSQHVGTLIRNGERYDQVLFTEQLLPGLRGVLARSPILHPVDLDSLPRFNEGGINGPRAEHPVADYYDDTSHAVMTELYEGDFELFGYDPDDPGRAHALGPIDLGRLHARYRPEEAA